jgi:hypothetical protein
MKKTMYARQARWQRVVAGAAVVTLGSAGMVGFGASTAQAAEPTPAARACTDAGGQATDQLLGWVTRCVLSEGAYTWSPTPGTGAITFVLSGAQGAGDNGAGKGGQVTGNVPKPWGPFQINVGRRDGSSGEGGAYDGSSPKPFAGGAASNGGGNGGGATVVRAKSAPPTQPLLVAGGGGGAGELGWSNWGEDRVHPGGAGGNGGSATTNGSTGNSVTFYPAGGVEWAGGAGGFGGSAGGAGATLSFPGGNGGSGSNVGSGGTGSGGRAGNSVGSWNLGNGGGGGGGYAGGGGGVGGYEYSKDNLDLRTGGGGGGGGTSWVAPNTVRKVTYLDGVKTGDGTVVIITNMAGAYDPNGFSFAPGQRLISGAVYTTGNYALIMQTDGNLVEYNADRKAIWSSGTFNHPGAYAILQSDGNFCIYGRDGGFLWHTNTTQATRFAFQKDGNLVLYISSGAPNWASGTVGK